MAKFNIKTANNGQFYFILVARNGKTIATSETYLTRQACYKGITSVQRNAPIADIIERGREKFKHVMCCMHCNWTGNIHETYKLAASDEYCCPDCGLICVPQDIGDPK
jgi:uncharacterized protein YegP (UPF0339 family)